MTVTNDSTDLDIRESGTSVDIPLNNNPTLLDIAQGVYQGGAHFKHAAFEVAKNGLSFAAEKAFLIASYVILPLYGIAEAERYPEHAYAKPRDILGLELASTLPPMLLLLGAAIAAGGGDALVASLGFPGRTSEVGTVLFVASMVGGPSLVGAYTGLRTDFRVLAEKMSKSERVMKLAHTQVPMDRLNGLIPGRKQPPQLKR